MTIKHLQFLVGLACPTVLGLVCCTSKITDASNNKQLVAKPPVAVADMAVEDARAYQHGIDFIALPDGSYSLIWASSGNPPTGAKPDGSWPHDIYYAKIDPATPKITPVTLISKPEAQEPVSAAISSDGHIMMTMEDGWNTANQVAQRYGVYDHDFSPVLAYPRLVFDGGHSGHVAAVDNRFVIFYADDWIDGGGVDNLGTGNDVKAHIYSATGVLEARLNIAVGDANRDWWPLVAGSKTRAALVWQRYVDGQTYSDLMVSIVDVKTKTQVLKALKIESAIKYYTYSVAYLPSIERFLVLGAYHSGGGFAYLLDQDGNIMASNKTLPAIVRESQPITWEQPSMVRVVQPLAPKGLMVLSVTPSAISLKTTITDDYQWHYSGTDGIFINANTVYIVSTSHLGLVEKTFHLFDNN
jgi:hypothetical protein